MMLLDVPIWVLVLGAFLVGAAAGGAFAFFSMWALSRR
jgi:hypothetical protein